MLPEKTVRNWKCPELGPVPNWGPLPYYRLLILSLDYISVVLHNETHLFKILTYCVVIRGNLAMKCEILL